MMWLNDITNSGNISVEEISKVNTLLINGSISKI